MPKRVQTVGEGFDLEMVTHLWGQASSNAFHVPVLSIQMTRSLPIRVKAWGRVESRLSIGKLGYHCVLQVEYMEMQVVCLTSTKRFEQEVV